jgi:hypothetical protein
MSTAGAMSRVATAALFSAWLLRLIVRDFGTGSL